MRQYLPYADSPTIRSYTRWERFEEALKRRGKANVYGADRVRLALPKPESWYMEEHLKRAETFRVTSEEVRVSPSGGTAFLHIEGRVAERFFLLEDSLEAPLSITGRLRGEGEVHHVVLGKGPHYSRWELEGDLIIRTYVQGEDVYLRYVGRGNIEAYGVSEGGRSDVHHRFIAENTRTVNSHLLIGKKNSFLVHRPLLIVKGGGYGEAETLLFKGGGLLVGVPSVEVYSSQVRGARHRVKDLVQREDQILYLRSRGFTPEEAKHFILEETKRALLGSLYQRLKRDLKPTVQG